MSQENNIEVRRLPKKTIIIIVTMGIICFLGFLFIKFTKEMKMEEVLKSLGHNNISNVEVINKLSVEDKITKVKSTVYKVVFVDNNTNKECIGFVHRSNHGKYSDDINCK